MSGNVLQDVLELLCAQLVELRDPGVQARECGAVRSSGEQPREGGDLPAGCGRSLGCRDRQLLHRRRRHVHRDAQAHEVVDDEAIEETAEEMLRCERQRRAQAEDGVRRHAVRAAAPPR